jgi:CRP-like cAMP-binding protein
VNAGNWDVSSYRLELGQTLIEEDCGVKIGDAQLWERVDASPGQILCRPGDRTDSLYLIRSGRIEITEPQGRRILGSGEFFGELDFSEPESSQLLARALEVTSLLRIDGKCLELQLRQRCGGGPLRLKRLLGWGDQLIFLCEPASQRAGIP